MDSWRQKHNSLELNFEAFKTSALKQAEQLRADFATKSSEVQAQQAAAADYKAKCEELQRALENQRNNDYAQLLSAKVMVQL